MPLALTPTRIAIIAATLAYAAMVVAWQVAKSDAAQQRARVQAVAAERDRAQEAAQACSASVARLQELAAQRAREAAQARAAAHSRAQQHNQRADAALATPAAVPGDDYASARMRVDAWLKGRGNDVQKVWEQ